MTLLQEGSSSQRNTRISKLCVYYLVIFQQLKLPFRGNDNLFHPSTAGSLEPNGKLTKSTGKFDFSLHIKYPRNLPDFFQLRAIHAQQNAVAWQISD